jgi:hypothetical protein
MAIRITSTRIRYSTTTCLYDSNTRCKCNVKKTCLHSAPIQMARTRKAVLSQIAPCLTQITRPWMTAAWTSPLASSGRPTFPTNSTRCKRDILRAHHGRPLPLEEPKWCPHRKIIGVQGPALVEPTARLPLSVTFEIVGMTRVARRYPALAPHRTRPDWFIQGCTAGLNPRRTHHQSQALILRPHRGPKARVAPNRAKVVRPRHAPTASPRLRLCGAVTPKGTHFAMHAVCF